MLISRQSKALDVISWELPFKGTALVHSSAHKGGERYNLGEPNESKFFLQLFFLNHSVQNTLTFPAACTVNNSLLWLVVVSHTHKRRDESTFQMLILEAYYYCLNMIVVVGVCVCVLKYLCIFMSMNFVVLNFTPFYSSSGICLVIM